MSAAPTTGHLAAAEAAGFPADLLIPILPADAKPGANVDLQQVKRPEATRGKAPHYYHSSGWWRGLPDWRNGTTAERRRVSDEAGANAGLILGSPVGGATYLALDVDTEWSEADPESQRRAEEICQIVIE